MNIDTKVYRKHESPTFGNTLLGAVPLVSEVYLMDNIELMKHYPDKYFDLAVVDPPYGINIGTEIDRSGFKEGTSKNSMTKFEKSMKDKSWDNETPNYEYFLELFRVIKNQIIWGGNYFLEHLPNTRCMITWDKMTYVPTMSQVELAWTSFKKHSLLKKINSNQLDRTHPTQKPVALLEYLIKTYTNEGETVLDNCMGSGTTGVACKNLNRNFIGIELDQEYFKIAKKRINEGHKGNEKLREGING